MIRDLGRARARRDEVANCLLEVTPKAIDEAGSLITALVVDAMLQRPERVWARSWSIFARVPPSSLGASSYSRQGSTFLIMDFFETKNPRKTKLKSNPENL